MIVLWAHLLIIEEILMLEKPGKHNSTMFKPKHEEPKLEDYKAEIKLNRIVFPDVQTGLNKSAKLPDLKFTFNDDKKICEITVNHTSGQTGEKTLQQFKVALGILSRDSVTSSEVDNQIKKYKTFLDNHHIKYEKPKITCPSDRDMAFT